ncbi:hypothetical protein HMF7854_04225 [Sphingomonas ginkgonis]|uniref:SWIM-type domain-containing protein n=1 Tax=Sphingomonas ginkgonis TaxID=2315330 RepID=A0A429V8D4_9SPHN|nr:hypothetical protein HMF7854_04225 [Sphingomonas ginkgonis]
MLAGPALSAGTLQIGSIAALVEVSCDCPFFQFLNKTGGPTGAEGCEHLLLALAIDEAEADLFQPSFDTVDGALVGHFAGPACNVGLV